MEAIEIKNKVAENLAGMIGTYTKGGLIYLPAIWVGFPPQDYLAKGLEILINEFPETSEHKNQIIHEFWSITLTQFPDTAEHLTQAARILRSLFRPSTLVFIQKPKTTEVQDLQILPQAILTWENKEILY